MQREFFIAGLKFHQYKDVLGILDKDIELRLESESTNKFDPNAVKILLDDCMLGYVPAKYSAEVSAFLEIAENPICRITEFDKEAKTWNMVKVVIEEGGNDDA